VGGRVVGWVGGLILLASEEGMDTSTNNHMADTCLLQRLLLSCLLQSRLLLLPLLLLAPAWSSQLLLVGVDPAHL
jgi:hypothetical protein